VLSHALSNTLDALPAEPVLLLALTCLDRRRQKP
jgi:hypothetical protein